MRIIKSYLIWLILPATLLGLAIFFTPISIDDNISDESLADLVYVKSDKKLNRTVKKWIGNVIDSGSNSSLDTPGLPVDMYIKEDEWEALQNPINRRYFKKNRYDFIIQFNDALTHRGTYKLRGAGSLKRAYKEGTPDRVCYNIRLFKSVRFRPDVKLKRIYLMNMIFDQTYFKMRFSYKLLHEIGLFPSYHQYVSLTVNGKPQGVYLLVERPQDAVVRTKRGVIGVYRRRNPKGGQQVYETKYQKPQESEKWQIDRLHEIINTLHGDKRINELQKIMNLEAYLTWLAFNTLVMCNDTSDEVYYYIVQSENYPDGRIEFSAWDYDDIMDPNLPDYAIKDPLLFGAENELDKCIHSDSALYDLYKAKLYDLLTSEITEHRLNTVLNEVHLEGDRLDTGLPLNEEKALKKKRKEDIKEFEGKLMARRSELLQRLVRH